MSEKIDPEKVHTYPWFDDNDGEPTIVTHFPYSVDEFERRLVANERLGSFANTAEEGEDESTEIE